MQAITHPKHSVDDVAVQDSQKLNFAAPTR